MLDGVAGTILGAFAVAEVIALFTASTAVQAALAEERLAHG